MASYVYSYDKEEKEVKTPKLKTDRCMWKLMLLHYITLGIYSIFFFIPFSFDLDKVAPKSDRSKTMNFALAWFLSLITFSVFLWVWFYQVGARIEEALDKRNILHDFDSSSAFWGWYVVGGLILVGPFIYFHKLCKAMNLLCESYNENPVAESV